MDWSIFQHILPFSPWKGYSFLYWSCLWPCNLLLPMWTEVAGFLFQALVFGGILCFCLPFWEYLYSTMRKIHPRDMKPLWPGHQNETQGEDLYLTNRLKQSCLCQSAEHEQEMLTVVYARDILSGLAGMQQKQTNTKTPPKMYLRLWKQLDGRTAKIFFSESIMFGISTQLLRLCMMKGTKLIKMCRFWLLKIITPLGCCISMHELYMLRAFINVNVYTLS